MTEYPEQAKQLFRKFAGSHFMMYREGVSETYEAYGIPPETEHQWRIELRDEHKNGYEHATDVVTLVHHFDAYGSMIADLKDKKALRYMFTYLKKHFRQLDTVTAYRLVSAVGSSASAFDASAHMSFLIKRSKYSAGKQLRMTYNYLSGEWRYNRPQGEELWTAENRATERKMARKLLPILEELSMNPFSMDETWKTAPLSQFCTEASIRKNIHDTIVEYNELLTTYFQRLHRS